MSKNFKLFLGFTYLLLLAVFLYFIFSNIQINRLNEFLYYKELQLGLENFISANFLINIIYFFIFAVAWVALLGFGSPILIFSGILFGKWIGTIISIISISIGALILYTIANFFFRDTVKKILDHKFKKYIQLFQKNEFYYFFLYRFIGGLGVPFFLQNIFPVLFNMKKKNYFFSSLFGFVPGFFIFNTIGAGLNNYIEKSENFSFLELVLLPEIYFPILMFIVLIIISLLIKKKFFSDVN
ncbi:VTT domain-containing protein [Pelagibacteraceae bacterium]|nr:VTT domain-containing protein [Pelagibacteraceae bacterium]|tara:strand:- start:139 stop:861 length:723 start_codon:yes stop_codon:yes gene_type:complete